jgi:hypothetical protein
METEFSPQSLLVADPTPIYDLLFHLPDLQEQPNGTVNAIRKH